MAAFVSLVLEGIEDLVSKLLHRLADSKAKDPGGFTVGYADPIAIYVHENLNAYHPNGQAKFLEQPTVQGHHDMAVTIQRAMGQDLGLKMGNRQAGIQLLQASQELVPTDTETLKWSGYVRDNDSNQTVYGNEDTPEQIEAWRQLIKDQHRLQDMLQQGFKT